MGGFLFSQRTILSCLMRSGSFIDKLTWAWQQLPNANGDKRRTVDRLDKDPNIQDTRILQNPDRSEVSNYVAGSSGITSPADVFSTHFLPPPGLESVTPLMAFRKKKLPPAGKQICVPTLFSPSSSKTFCHAPFSVRRWLGTLVVRSPISHFSSMLPMNISSSSGLSSLRQLKGPLQIEQKLRYAPLDAEYSRNGSGAFPPFSECGESH